MQRMPVIPPKFGVGAFERRISVCFGLFDATFWIQSESSLPNKEAV